MSPEDARVLFLPIHGVVGVLALVGGIGALAVQKGSPIHRWLGRAFVVGLLGAALAAQPVIWVTGNLFLGGMGCFAAYMTWAGFAIVRCREAAGRPVDQAISAGMIVIGLAFAAYGVRALLAGSALGAVPVAMGLGSALFARHHLRWFRAPRSSRRSWVAMHVGAIGGGLIAGLTAFGAATLTNYVPMVPEPVVWLLPTAILSPLLRRASSRIP
jgi:hypothetical protein